MQERVEKRLKELKSEFESGQKMLMDFETKQANLRSTLLRISGAIQVLEEVMAAENGPAGKGNGHPIKEYAEPVSSAQQPPR
jgi:hypothetical protein